MNKDRYNFTAATTKLSDSRSLTIEYIIVVQAFKKREKTPGLVFPLGHPVGAGRADCRGRCEYRRKKTCKEATLQQTWKEAT